MVITVKNSAMVQYFSLIAIVCPQHCCKPPCSVIVVEKEIMGAIVSMFDPRWGGASSTLVIKSMTHKLSVWFPLA